MVRMLCLVFVVVAAFACKKKEQAKPAPAQTVPSAPTAPTPAPALPGDDTPPPAPELPSSPPPPAEIKPAGGLDTAAEYEQKAFDVLDKLGDVFASSGTNCDKLADRLAIFIDENQAALASTDAFAAANPTAKTTLDAKMQDKAKTFRTKATASLQACQKHEGVKAALAKLPD